MTTVQAGPESWPTVSVVVPTVRRPRELRRAVASIVAQDYPGPIETLVVYDGTDPMVPDVPLGPDRTVRALVNARTPGLPGNRNTGYLAARGAFVAACDDDDEWLPTKVSTQVRLLQRNPAAVLCSTAIVIRQAGRDHVRRFPRAELTLDDLLRHRHVEVCPSSSLFRRQLIDGGVLVDEAMTGGYGEDYEWLFRVVRAGTVLALPDPLTIVHFGDASFFVANWARIEDGLHHLLDVVPEFRAHPAGLARIEGQLALAVAAQGRRRRALVLAVRSLRRSRRARQGWAALAVAAGLLSADRLAAIARRSGRGV